MLSGYCAFCLRSRSQIWFRHTSILFAPNYHSSHSFTFAFDLHMTVFFVVEPVLVLLRFRFFNIVVFTHKSKHLEKFAHDLMLRAAVLFLLLALPAQKHQSRDSGIQFALSLAPMGCNFFKHFLNSFGFILFQKCLAQCFLSAPPCLTSPWDRWDGKRGNFNRSLDALIVSLHQSFYSFWVCACHRPRLQQSWSIRASELEDLGPWLTHDGTI